ncbi:Ataxin-3, partial [Quaeritorhiza haematococci]
MFPLPAGHYFTAVDLADIGRQLDLEEQQAMAEGGTDSAEYHRFLQEGSSNYDDSGFFSVQVISTALKVWNLELVPFGASSAAAARENPTWYNLNSLYKQAEYVSETYLGLLLAQLKNEGYSIFIVEGPLPASEADNEAMMSPQPPPEALPSSTSASSSSPSRQQQQQAAPQPFQGTGYRLGGDPAPSASGTGNGNDEDSDIAAAIAMSLGQEPPQQSFSPFGQGGGNGDEEDPELRRVLTMSMAEADADDKTLKAALQASMAEAGIGAPGEEEEDAVQRAIAMSLGGGNEAGDN